MESKYLYYALMFFSAFMASIAQVMLKKSSMLKYNNRYREYLNVYVISGYSIFFATTILGVFVFKIVPLKMGPIAEASGYIWIAVLNYVMFGKFINIKIFIGLSIICIGMIVFNL